MFLMWIVPLLFIGLVVYAISGGKVPNALRPSGRACPNCSRAVRNDWKNCPHCGQTL